MESQAILTESLLNEARAHILWSRLGGNWSFHTEIHYNIRFARRRSSTTVYPISPPTKSPLGLLFSDLPDIVEYNPTLRSGSELFLGLYREDELISCLLDRFPMEVSTVTFNFNPRYEITLV